MGSTESRDPMANKDPEKRIEGLIGGDPDIPTASRRGEGERFQSKGEGLFGKGEEIISDLPATPEEIKKLLEEVIAAYPPTELPKPEQEVPPSPQSEKAEPEKKGNLAIRGLKYLLTPKKGSFGDNIGLRDWMNRKIWREKKLSPPPPLAERVGEELKEGGDEVDEDIKKILEIKNSKARKRQWEMFAFKNPKAAEKLKGESSELKEVLGDREKWADWEFANRLREKAEEKERLRGGGPVYEEIENFEGMSTPVDVQEKGEEERGEVITKEQYEALKKDLTSKESELEKLIRQGQTFKPDESLVGMARRAPELRDRKNELIKEIVEIEAQMLEYLKVELAKMEEKGVIMTGDITKYNVNKKFREFLKDEWKFLKDRGNIGFQIERIEKRAKEQEENERIREEIRQNRESGNEVSAAALSVKLGLRYEAQDNRFLFEQSSKNDIIKFHLDRAKKVAGLIGILGIGTIVAGFKGIWAMIKGAKTGKFMGGWNEGWKMVNNWGKKEK